MAEILEIQMPPGQVVDAIKQMKAQMASLEQQVSSLGVRGGSSGDHIGQSYLRGERFVARASSNMVASLLQVNNAADAASAVLMNSERMGKFGLGLAVGLAVGVSAFEQLHEQVVATAAAEEAFRASAARPMNLIAKLDYAGLVKEYDTAAAALAEKQKQENSTRQIVLDVLKYGPLQSQRDPIEAQRLSEDNQEERRLQNIAELRGKSALAMANAAEASLRITSAEGEVLKNNLEAESKIATIRLKKNPDAGDRYEIEAIAKTRDLKNEAARNNEFDSRFSIAEQTNLANFRGTPEERTQVTLNSNLASAKRDLLEAGSNILKQDKANLEVAKAQLDIYQHQVELRKQALDFAASGQEMAIKMATAAGAVGLGPEATQRAGLQSGIDLAGVKSTAAGAAFLQDPTDIAKQQGYLKSLGEEEIAKSALAKFDNDKAFAHAQELNAAKATTAEMLAQSKGQNFLANVLKTREAAEQKIAGYLRDQKGDLAAHAAIQGKLAIQKQLSDRLSETPEQTRSREAAERTEAHNEDVAAMQIKDAAHREARGTKLDENNPVTQALRAQQAIDRGENPLSENGGSGSQDFSSLISLSGQDFSGLASLAEMDFSGLESLSGLTIAIA